MSACLGICVLAFAGRASAQEGQPAQIGLTANLNLPAAYANSTAATQPSVIVGAVVPVTAVVQNTAPVDSDALNYTIAYSGLTGQSGEQYLGGGSDSLAPGDTTVWTPYDYTSYQGVGNQNITVTVSAPAVGDTPAASNSPVSSSLPFVVLAHAAPAFVINSESVTPPYVNPNAPETPDTGIQAPQLEPQSFGGTGGGESASFASPGMLGDPAPGVPTAGLALNSITYSGSNEIYTTLQPFTYLPGDDTTVENWDWDVYTDTPGTYQTTVLLGFSDEQDLLGANAPNSIYVAIQFTATVYSADDATGTYVFLENVPEPASLSSLAMGSVLLFRRRVRRR
jgi:hypothetical protein